MERILRLHHSYHERNVAQKLKLDLFFPSRDNRREGGNNKKDRKKGRRSRRKTRKAHVSPLDLKES
jgi:hypothetical protein